MPKKAPPGARVSARNIPGGVGPCQPDAAPLPQKAFSDLLKTTAEKKSSELAGICKKLDKKS